MNYILGSGITGLLARFILGDDWTVIPFYRSRFYSYTPPLCDNFIIADPKIDDIITSLGYSSMPVLVKRAYSSQGALHWKDDGVLADVWLSKLFGDLVPSHAPAYYRTRSSVWVYDKVRVNKLYVQLLQDYREHIQSQVLLGQVSSIDGHTIVRGDKRVEFERLVSTVPLDVLMRLLGKSQLLKYKSIHYIHMETRALDFEGASQVFVVDPQFSFYKVSAIAKNRYMFYCHEEIGNPGAYFMPIIPGDYDLIDGTMVAQALPLGEIPNFGLEADGIFTVGSFAQHDACADVGSNVLRLVQYAGTDFRPRMRSVTFSG